MASSTEIPIIDISDIDTSTGTKVIDAATQYGFLFVKGENLGFTRDIVENMFGLTKRFFNSPIEEKRKLSHSSGNTGWAGLHAETLDPANQKRGDFKETLNFGIQGGGNREQLLTPKPQASEGELNDFVGLCEALCRRLLQLFALGLQLIPSERGGQHWFASKHDRRIGPTGSVFRWLHYPAMDSTSFERGADVRAGAHSDYGSLTLLFRRAGEPGLEILDPASRWISVPISPLGTATMPFPPILVNIGDLLQFWTNGMLKSTIHRVVFPDEASQDRYSIAYFCHPLDQELLEAIPSKFVKEKGACGAVNDKQMTAGEYLKTRLKATYE